MALKSNIISLIVIDIYQYMNISDMSILTV